MAYFDSPKNRAMWKKELDRLREQREFRKTASLEEIAALRRGRQIENTEAQNNPLRERVSYQQLLKEEHENTMAKRNETVKTASVHITKQAEKKHGEPTL